MAKIVKPEEGFNPARKVSGVVLLSKRPGFIPKLGKATGAQSRGIRYEYWVREKFERELGKAYCHGQWFEFLDRGQRRWCQTDGIWLDTERGILTIFEIKYRHKLKAWWQLRKLYSPVLWAYLKEIGEKRYRVAVCEVVRVFDPLKEFPEPVKIIRGLEELAPGRFNVLRLDPRIEMESSLVAGPEKHSPNLEPQARSVSLLDSEVCSPRVLFRDVN